MQHQRPPGGVAAKGRVVEGLAQPCDWPRAALGTKHCLLSCEAGHAESLDGHGTAVYRTGSLDLGRQKSLDATGRGAGTSSLKSAAAALPPVAHDGSAKHDLFVFGAPSARSGSVDLGVGMATHWRGVQYSDGHRTRRRGRTPCAAQTPSAGLGLLCPPTADDQVGVQFSTAPACSDGCRQGRPPAGCCPGWAALDGRQRSGQRVQLRRTEHCVRCGGRQGGVCGRAEEDGRRG